MELKRTCRIDQPCDRRITLKVLEEFDETRTAKLPAPGSARPKVVLHTDSLSRKCGDRDQADHKEASQHLHNDRSW